MKITTNNISGTGSFIPTKVYSNGGWLPLDAWETTDFSSDNDEEEETTIDYAEEWHRKYEVLQKRLDRINRYLDDILKYNATAKLTSVISVVKGIANGESDRKTNGS